MMDFFRVLVWTGASRIWSFTFNVSLLPLPTDEEKSNSTYTVILGILRATLVIAEEHKTKS